MYFFLFGCLAQVLHKVLVLSSGNSLAIHNWCHSVEQGGEPLLPTSAVNSVAVGNNLEHQGQVPDMLTVGIPHVLQNIMKSISDG